MFNLLPESEKQNIMKEYSLRRAVVLSLFLFAVGSIASVSLLPSYLLSRAKIQETGQEIESIKKSSTFKESGQLSDSLAQTNSKLQALKPGTTDEYVEDLFAKIFSDRDVNIRITSIMYQEAVNKTPGFVTMNGIAHDRQSLSAFVDKLKNEPVFTQVDLPVSDLAKDRNADFSIKIQGKF